MIIRRKHTANFTTIGNALFNDERLKADEIGIIGYLLSRPHDWEVRRPQLAKRFGYGRDAIKRVMWNAMRFGWVVAQKTKLSDGRFFTVYEVMDQPGPELSDDEIRHALSLGSSEASESDESDASGTGDADTGDPPATGQPAPGEPAPGQPATGNPYVASKEEATKPGFTKDESTKGECDFARVRSLWPADFVLSYSVCEGLHVGLSEEVQAAAIRYIKTYLDDCKTQGRKVCDLATYYRERRWERFAARDAQLEPNKPAMLKPFSAQWHRWREYRIATGQSITFMESQARLGHAWSERTEWPPPLPAKPVGAAPPTQPGSTMTPDDHATMAADWNK